MQIRNLILSILVLGLTACSHDGLMGEFDPMKPTMCELAIRASHATMTRTELGDGDGTFESEQEIRWSDKDRIMVWAKAEGASDYTFAATPFQLYTYNATYSSADFLATLPEMVAGTYSYYATYPEPQQVSGTQVSYTLPASQNGAYNPSLDLMVASTSGNALTAHTTGDLLIGWEEPELSFSHLCHLIRIRIPENKNLLGRPIKRLDITFPQPVVGTATFDVTNPENTLQWTELSNKVTVLLDDDKMIDAGQGYIWLHVKPTELNGEVTFSAYDGNGIKAHDIRTTLQKSMNAQRITPIALTIPGPYIPIIYLDLREEANHLGEPWQKITLSGLTFGDGTPSGTTSSVTVHATDVDHIVAVYPALNSDGTPDMTSVQGATLTVTYESEHAKLQNRTIQLPNTLQPTTEYTTPLNTIPFTVPYLFEENFDNVLGENYANLDWGSGNETGKTMDGVNLPGWMGAAWQTTAGTSLTVAAYIGSTWWGTATDCANGRVDSATLPLTQSGVTITVNYMVSGKTEATQAKNSCYFGTSTNTQPVNATTKLALNLPDKQVANYEINNGGSATNINVSKTHTIAGCSSATRLTWCCNPTSVANSITNFVSSKYFYVYVDEIKVSIGNSVQ